MHPRSKGQPAASIIDKVLHSQRAPPPHDPLPRAMKSISANSPPSDSETVPAVSSRSRNAKAQARHRAKRKAYIEQVGVFVLTITQSVLTT